MELIIKSNIIFKNREASVENRDAFRLKIDEIILFKEKSLSILQEYVQPQNMTLYLRLAVKVSF